MLYRILCLYGVSQLRTVSVGGLVVAPSCYNTCLTLPDLIIFASLLRTICALAYYKIMAKEIVGGVAHNLPADLQKALVAAPKALAAWQNITPLARNEWICWTVTVKNPVTRKNHIERTVAELIEGKRRPCCWLGCVHRTDKAVSPSQRYVMNKRLGSR